MRAEQRSPTWRNIRLRPTKFGVILLVMIVLLWLVGVNYQVNLAYAVAFWLLGFMMIGVILNALQLIGLALDLSFPEEIFEGQSATISLHPAASSPKRSRFLWFASIEEDFLPDESSFQAADFSQPQAEPVLWHMTATERGYLTLPPLLCSTVWPFAISTARCIWHWPQQAIVYPAPIAHQAPPSSQPSHTDQQRRRPYGSEDIAYLQEHTAGTSMQHVAWKVYAKTGQMLDKRFEEPDVQQASHIIHYADYPHTTPNRLAGLLCYRVLSAHAEGVAYTLILPQQTIAPQNGQREKCLTALALM